MISADVHRQALLTRAGIVEAQRQAAHDRGDKAAEQAAERELAQLWREFVRLGDRAA